VNVGFKTSSTSSAFFLLDLDHEFLYRCRIGAIQELDELSAAQYSENLCLPNDEVVVREFLRDGHQCDGHCSRSRSRHGWRKDLDVFCGKGSSDYMRQQLQEAHTTMYGLCFAYILEIT
jgi:hypothetical protein